MNEKSKKKKGEWALASWDDRVFLIIVYSLLILLALICAYPLYFTIIASISDPHSVYLGKISFLPKGFTTEAYELVFQNKMIWKGYLNSIFYTACGTFFNLLLTIPAAYALSKKQLIWRTPLTVFLSFTMYFSGGMIPTYLLFKSLGMLNNMSVMIFAGGISIYNVIVTRTYFQNNIPESLCEAARIDGANEFQIFFRLVIPLSAPIIAVMTLYYAVGHWNNYFDGMVYLTNTNLQPLQVVLRKILIINENAYQEAILAETDSATLLQDAARRTYLAITMKYSVVFIASLPMLIIYPFIQKHFVKGVMIGAVKE